MNRDIETIRALEESLWREETRFDTDYLDRLLAADFLEFGQSGRIYSRAEILKTPSIPIRCTLPLIDFAAHQLANNIVLVTYISKVLTDGWQYANRSSIWIKNASGWQLRFHQGTPFTPV